MNWINFAARNILRHKRRSALTLALGALAVASILLAGGFALFTFEGLKQQATRDSGHLILTAPGYFAANEDALKHGLDNHAALSAELLRLPEVRAVLPRLPFSGLISNGDKSLVFIGAGIDPLREFQVKGPFVRRVAGNLLEDTQAAGQTPQVLLGRELAASLESAPGTSVTLLSTTAEGALNAIDFTVRGVIFTGVPAIDERLVLVALPSAQQLLATAKVGRLAVHLADDEEATGSRLAAAIAAAQPTLAQRSWREEAFYYEGVRALYVRIFGILIGILLTLSLFAVANTISMSVAERTREIGAFRALGYTPGEMRRLFAWEGGFLGAGAALLGMGLALLFTLAVSLADIQMPPPPGRSDGYPLGINLSATLYVCAALAISGLSGLVAWFAARRASLQAIPEALEHV